MSAMNIGRAVNHFGLGECKGTRSYRTNVRCKQPDKPALAPLPETREQRILRQRLAAAGRLAKAQVDLSGAYLDDLNAAARAWAAATGRGMRQPIIEAFAKQHRIHPTTAGVRMRAQARVLGLIP